MHVSCTLGDINAAPAIDVFSWAVNMALRNAKHNVNAHCVHHGGALPCLWTASVKESYVGVPPLQITYLERDSKSAAHSAVSRVC